MHFPSFLKTLLVSYLVGCLCAAPSLAVGTAGSIVLPSDLSSSAPSGYESAPMEDGSTSFAQGFTSDSKGKPGSLTSGGGTGEFISGNYPGAVLIPVTIFGPIPKQGIHHIPTKTSLVKFLSLAGGITSNAILDEVVIKRVASVDKALDVVNGEQIYKEEIITVNVEDLLENPGSRGPILQQDDMVIIKESKPFFSNDALVAVGLVSSILGIVVSTMVITDKR